MPWPHLETLLTWGQLSNEPAPTQGLTKTLLGWTCHPSHFYLPSPAQLSSEFPSSATVNIPRCCLNVPQNEDSGDRYSWEIHVIICFKNLTCKGVTVDSGMLSVLRSTAAKNSFV